MFPANAIRPMQYKIMTASNRRFSAATQSKRKQLSNCIFQVKCSSNLLHEGGPYFGLCHPLSSDKFSTLLTSIKTVYLLQRGIVVHEVVICEIKKKIMCGGIHDKISKELIGLTLKVCRAYYSINFPMGMQKLRV